MCEIKTNPVEKLEAVVVIKRGFGTQGLRRLLTLEIASSSAVLESRFSAGGWQKWDWKLEIV